MPSTSASRLPVGGEFIGSEGSPERPPRRRNATPETLLDDAPAFDLVEHIDDALSVVHRQQRRLGGRAAEVCVARARDALYLVRQKVRKGRPYLPFDDLAANGERAIAERPESSANG